MESLTLAHLDYRIADTRNIAMLEMELSHYTLITIYHNSLIKQAQFFD